MMMNSVFALASLGWGERISTAVIVTLQGMLTIFLVLAILWGAIEVMHRLVHRKKPNKEAAPAPTPQPAPAQTVAPAPAVEDDGALIAAITAAISATLAEEGYQGGFRVVSFCRVGDASKRKN